MRIVERHGEVCIASAATLATGHDDFLIIGARAVYISHSPLTKDQCELLKPGVIVRLERTESVDSRRDVLGDVPPGKPGGVQPDGGSVAGLKINGDTITHTCGKRLGKLFGVFRIVEHPFVFRLTDYKHVAHCSSFLRRVGRVVGIAFPSLTRRRKVPFVSSDSVGGER